MHARRFRKMGYGLLAAGLVGGTALGLGDPPQPDNPFISRVRPAAAVVDLDVNLALTQNPSVALEWAGPNRLRVRERGEYTLTVRNTCGQPLQKVSVQVRVPKAAAVTAVAPSGRIADEVIAWELPALEPGATVQLKLTLAGQTRGELGCQAWVTFTGTAGMSVAVREPKLACRVIAPDAVAVGDALPVTYVVTNTGDTRLTDVVLRRGAIDEPVPPLDPGQEFRKAVEERPTAGGERAFPASVVGSENTAAEATARVRVLVPKLTATIAGPAERMVGRKGTYTLTLTNAGEVPVYDIRATTELPAGLRLLDSSGSPTGTGGAVSFLKALAPGEKQTLTYEAIATTPGGGPVTVAVTGSRGTTAKAECRTKVDGVPAIRMEVVDLADPVEVTGTTTYEVRIVNTGSKAAAAVGLVCELPNELRYVSCDGPTAGRELERVGVDFLELGVNKDVGVKAEVGTRTHTTVTFDPISELAPKTEAVYRVKVKAVAAGDVRFKATLTSRSLSAPVAKEESTRVFGE